MNVFTSILDPIIYVFNSICDDVAYIFGDGTKSYETYRYEKLQARKIARAGKSTKNDSSLFKDQRENLILPGSVVVWTKDDGQGFVNYNFFANYLPNGNICLYMRVFPWIDFTLSREEFYKSPFVLKLKPHEACLIVDSTHEPDWRFNPNERINS